MVFLAMLDVQYTLIRTESKFIVDKVDMKVDGLTLAKSFASIPLAAMF